MSIQLMTITPIVTAAGVRAPISTSHIAVTSISFQADDSNTGNVFIGDATVTSSNGMILSKGNTAALTGDAVGKGGTEEFYLDEVYVVGSATSDIVRLSCFRRRP